MAFGIAAPGRSPEHHAQEGRFRSLDEYRELIRAERPAGTDRHHAHERQHQRGADDPRAAVRRQPRDAGRPRQRRHRRLGRPGRRLPATAVARPSARPRSTRPCAASRPASPSERTPGADLGLYSVTFNNDLALDHRTLEATGPSARRRRPRAFATSSKSSIPTPRRTPLARPGAVHQRHDRADPGRRGGQGAAAVPQGRLPWPRRHGTTGRLRFAADRGHPRRVVRHHLRRLPSTLGSEEVRRPRRPSTAG